MSTGSTPIPLLKAAPEADQLAERLEGGPWRGLELALFARHIADDDALARAVETVRDAGAPASFTWTAEAPVSWPSGAFVRVDRLDDEARAGIERSAEFARAIGSPVLTIHLFAPMSPEEYAAGGDPRRRETVQALPALLRRRLPSPRRDAVHRERPARPAHAHRRRVPVARRRPLARPARLARARPGAPLHVRHVARRAVPQLRRRLRLAVRAHVGGRSRPGPLRGGARAGGRGRTRLGCATACSARACRTARASSTSTRSCARLAATVPYLVAEINEPDPARSPDMKAAYRAIERALSSPCLAPERKAAPPAARRLRLADRPAAARPGAGAARAPGALRRPARARHRRRRLDRHRAHHVPRSASVPSASRCSTPTRPRSPPTAARATPPPSRAMQHVLCDIRDPGRVEREIARRARTSSSTSPRTSTSTGRRATRTSSSRPTWSAAGTSCAPPTRRASTRSSWRRPTRRRWPPASTAGPSASWSS